MASRRTTVVLTADEEQALKRAARAEGISQSALIRKGIRNVTSEYRRTVRPLTGWLKLTVTEKTAVLDDDLGDFGA